MTDISIIIPVFNQEVNLSRVFSSFHQKQTNIQYEIIFVDDGSTDNSKNLIKDFKINNPTIKIHYFLKENGGVSSARNYGIGKAHGKYIWFVDPDDSIILENLNAMYQSVENDQSDILIFGYSIFDISNNNSTLKNIKNKRYTANEDFVDLATQHLIECVWNKLFRTSFLLENHIKFNENLSIGEDFLFVMDSLLSTNSIIMSDLISYQYFINTNSLSKRFIPNIVYLRKSILEKFLKYSDLKNIDITKITDLFIIETFISSVTNSIRSKESFSINNTYDEITTINKPLKDNKIKTNFNNKKFNIISLFINLKLDKMLIIFIYLTKRKSI